MRTGFKYTYVYSFKDIHLPRCFWQFLIRIQYMWSSYRCYSVKHCAWLIMAKGNVQTTRKTCYWCDFLWKLGPVNMEDDRKIRKVIHSIWTQRCGVHCRGRKVLFSVANEAVSPSILHTSNRVNKLLWYCPVINLPFCR